MPLSATNLSFAYTPARPVVRAFSATFAPAAITAIVGPNGCGKSTLLRLLLGALAPSAGRITLDDLPLRTLRAADRAKRLAYIAQRPALAVPMTVRQVIALSRYALPHKASEAIDEALDRVGLRNRQHDLLHALSAGQQQLVSLARALAQLHPLDTPSTHMTRVLLADEPTASMDPLHALETMQQLRRLADHSVTIIVVLHDLTSALRCADHALVLTPEAHIAAHAPVAQALTPENLKPVFGVDFQSIGEGRLAALLTTTA